LRYRELTHKIRGLDRMLRPDCLVRVRKNDSFPSFRYECEAGDQLARIRLLVWGKGEGREVTRLSFFFFLFFKKKIRGPTGSDPPSESLNTGNCESDTLTTAPNSLVIKLVSGVAHSRGHRPISKHSRKKGGGRKLHFVFSHWLWLSSKLCYYNFRFPTHIPVSKLAAFYRFEKIHVQLILQYCRRLIIL